MKLDWLTEFLGRHIGEKVLLITKSKTKVMCLETLMKDRFPGMNVAAFHWGFHLLPETVVPLILLILKVPTFCFVRK